MGRKSNEVNTRRIAEAVVAASRVPKTRFQRLREHWLVICLVGAVSAFAFLTDIRSWLPNERPPLSVAQEQLQAIEDPNFNPKANIRVVNYSIATGEGQVAVAVVNQGFKPILNFYMEWWVDMSIGSLYAGPAVFPQDLPFEGRGMMSFNTYISRTIPPGGRIPIWDIQLKNATRPGIYPMRLIFRSQDRTITHPASGLDLKGMMLEISSPARPK